MIHVPAEAAKNIKNAVAPKENLKNLDTKEVISLLEFEELKLRLTNSKEQMNELRDSL